MLVTYEAFAKFSQQDTWRLVDRVIVKGKSEPVELFECKNPCTPMNYKELCVHYKSVYNKYSCGKFAEAQSEFKKLAHEFSDGPAKILAARCAELSIRPPANWDGIWKMDAK
jgi:adenylate cyclase